MCKNDNHLVCFDESSHDGGYNLDLEDIKEILTQNSLTCFDYVHWFKFCPECGTKLDKDTILLSLVN